MDRLPETATRMGGRSEALHEGVHEGHVRTVAGTEGARRVTHQTRPTREGPTNSIRQFFAENPDEELTMADVMTKFDLKTFHARKVIGRLHSAGELVTVRKEGRVYFYGKAA